MKWDGGVSRQTEDANSHVMVLIDVEVGQLPPANKMMVRQSVCCTTEGATAVLCAYALVLMPSIHCTKHCLKKPYAPMSQESPTEALADGPSELHSCHSTYWLHAVCDHAKRQQLRLHCYAKLLLTEGVGDAATRLFAPGCTVTPSHLLAPRTNPVSRVPRQDGPAVS